MKSLYLFSIALIQLWRTWILRPIFFLWAKVAPRSFLGQRWNFESDKTVFFDSERTIDAAFEFASEGELQQVLPWVEWHLDQNKCVELIYSSPSVKEKVQELHRQYPTLIRSLRLPLLRYKKGDEHDDLVSWSRAKTRYLCRYDFFPEVVGWILRSRGASYLLSAKYWKRSWAMRFFQRFFYRQFQKIVCVSEREKEGFLSLGIPQDRLIVRELRALTIEKRCGEFSKAKTHWPLLSEVFMELRRWPRSRRLVLGNYWPEENQIIGPEICRRTGAGEMITAVVPHIFDDEETLLSSLKEVFPGMDLYLFRGDEDPKKWRWRLDRWKLKPGPWIFLLKGVLCELYTGFGHAYVGKGFTGSVHSLLEPHLAGAHVYCGPGVHRSTEYDFIKTESPDSLTLLNQPHELENHIFSDYAELRSEKQFGEIADDLKTFQKELFSLEERP